MPILNDNNQRHLRSEQTLMLYRGTWLPLVSSMGAGFLIYLTFAGVTENPLRLDLWFVGLMTISAARALDRVFYLRAVKKTHKAKPAIARFAVGTSATALTWALILPLFYPESDLIHTLLLVICIIGVSGAAAVSLSYSFEVAIATLSVINFGAAAFFLSRGTPAETVLFFLTVLQFLQQALTARRMSNNFAENIRLRQTANQHRQHALSRAKVAMVLQEPSPLNHRLSLVAQEIEGMMGLPQGSHVAFMRINPPGNEGTRLAVWGESSESTAGEEHQAACNAFVESQKNALAYESGGTTYQLFAIQQRHQTHGAICISGKNLLPFDPSQIETLHFIAQSAALAINNEKAAKAVEQAQKQSELASKAKSRFLASIGHEIRTPLYGVLGMLELLRDTKEPSVAAQQIEIANGSAKVLLNLLNDLLDISRADAGKLKLEHRLFNFRESVENSCDLYAAEAGKKGLEISCYLAPDIPEYAVGDAARLQQILNNLIANAVKFTHTGHIKIHVTQESTPLEAASPGVLPARVDIHDTGTGIAQDQIEQLFQPFSQGSDAPHGEHGGSGLGLNISQKLAEMMGGNISLQSELDNGSTFSLHIPLELDQQRSSSYFPPLDGHTVIVGNPENNLATSAQMIEWHFYGSYSFHQDTALAIDEIARRALAPGESPATVLLLDLQQQDLSTEELLWSIAQQLQQRGQPPVKLVFLGGIDTSPERTTNHYTLLHKPVHMHALYRALKHPKVGDLQVVARHSQHEPLQGTVLVVDDNLVNLAVGQAMIQRMGLNCLTATNAPQALSILEDTRADLILMDCQMPQMDGLEATRIIRRREGTSGHHTPIIALTANALSDNLQACLDAGMDDVLSKPLSSKKLARTIRPYLPKSPRSTDAVSPLHSQSTPPHRSFDDLLDTIQLDSLLETTQQGSKDLIALFLHVSETTVKNLKRLFFEQNHLAMASQFHSLKGGAQTMGASALAILCEEAEACCKKGFSPQLESFLSEVDTVLEATERAILSYLALHLPEAPHHDTDTQRHQR